ncbi:rRNA biogenesis protein RRP5-like isoform X1 [Papaver somniferum]|uniref:rRNA biogenesis protein RRP5-like isoform X1 n=1 Tax=Papaver somniferum TaxID=3469 RepID=UPI000E7005A7|nr:rRNA biogenesis protein RRP5-like isoform X1 [Papaver somniferum]
MAGPPNKSLKRKSGDSLKTPKTKQKSKDSTKTPDSIPQVEDDVPDFPRGGGSTLSRREESEIRAEVDAEFATEYRESKKKSKRQKKDTVEDDDFGSLFGDGIAGKLPRFANRITLKNVAPGMKLWGVIAEVNEKDIAVSLPGGLRGLVRADEASDLIAENQIKDSEGNFLSSIFHAGELVSCVVVQVDEDKGTGKGRKKIWLSLRLAVLHKDLTWDAIQEGMVLMAYVKSIEDHGYILHFGPSSFTGFLSRKNKDGVEIKGNAGQLLQGVVKSLDKARRVVHLSADPDTVSKSVTKDLKGISIDLLVPGMMINARVKSTLENGIMLSFLTYFTGTADVFHLQNSFPTRTWQEDYEQNKKVNARILFIDPSTRAVGLTMNHHLVHNKAPPSHVKTGDIYDGARVVRVDRGLGLLLEIPSTPIPTPAYVSISDVADEEVRKLEKKYKEGNSVRARILGFRHLEGLALGILKTSAFEGSVFTHSDAKPGMVVKGKVTSVGDFGAYVQLSTGVKALCPLTHMSELEVPKPRKKFKVGADLAFRVLGFKSRLISVTHKKTLVKSKLAILSSYDDATEGLITHGWIKKVETHGCFVNFYNGVQGFARRSELGLDPGCEASSMYHAGQVVKCRVMSAVPSSRRINISFLMSPTRTSEDAVLKLGSVVSGVVERLTPNAVIVKVNAEGYLKGTILTEHLADHQAHTTLMKSMLKPGHEFDQLVVLDVGGNSLILSAKLSLINSANELPSDIAQVHPHSIVHGYVCNSIEGGCFVRFLGRLTGFSPKNKALDDQRTDISEAFDIGQSVRSHVETVNCDTNRITLSLKQSSCFSTDTSFIQGYFILEDKIANMQMSDSKNIDFKWVESFNIGSVVEGVIHEIKEFGVVLRFKQQTDVFGFITHYQLGGTSIEKGSIVRAVVLDINKSERLVDLSLKPELVCPVKEDGGDNKASKKKRKRDKSVDMELHQTVNAVVELVKENYLVLSIPDFDHAIGYASIADYNTQKLPNKHFVNGQSVVATVEDLPSSSATGRFLLLLKSLKEVVETSSSKRAKKKSSYNVGSLVEAEVTDIRPLELRLKFGVNFHGRVHVTEASDEHIVVGAFSKIKVGQVLTARIVEKPGPSDKKSKKTQWELSIRPSLISGPKEIDDKLMTKESDFSIGKCITGYVVKVDSEWVWLTVSRHMTAKLFILDSATEPSEICDIKKRFPVGKGVTGHILSVNKEKNLIRLILHPLSIVSKGTLDTDALENVSEHVHEGDVRAGRISKILPGAGGLLVQIGPHLFGKVHFTELTDSWMPNPLLGYQEGQIVKYKVLEIGRSLKGTTHFDLSLRMSLQEIETRGTSELHTDVDSNKRFERIEELHPNMVVQGYVKNLMPKGCFIMLSRKIDAKILLSNLSDGFIENPEMEFPVGKLVNGKVLSVEPLSKRVEVSLKTGSANRSLKSNVGDFKSLCVGDVISGRIKRVETYGLFITIDQTNMVGLCHKSELAGEQTESIDSKYRAGEKVKAKILKVDPEQHRISLGMKNLIAVGDVNDDASVDLMSNQDSGEATDCDSDSDGSQTLQENDIPDNFSVDEDCTNEVYPFVMELESGDPVLPLEVTLDDVDDSGLDNIENGMMEHVNDGDFNAEKNKKPMRKKAKEERELEVSAAEQRLLEKDIPRTADEFEKFVRSSPNSSFVWIKYMAFMLSLADIEKARSIAERALRTINTREEAEKLNVWVAYFNLENEYGNPREEAVTKTFQRALQYCDPKKVHLALLGMYERTEQHKLANDLLDQMSKKFKHSCKVWLRRVQNLLSQGKDGIQGIVKRALLCLPRHKHIKFISQCAILEFKCGVPDRGRSMFEEMLREYPKRLDLWSVYLDQEIRIGDVDLIRALFERATSLSLPAKKMKFLFKKYLEYEKSCGDEERVEYVKEKAMEFVNSSGP